jgi:DNA-binding NtrC family response regulator
LLKEDYSSIFVDEGSHLRLDVTGFSSKILIVDDEPSIRFALGQALNAWGHLSVQAETVSSALRVFDEESPDAVLLDIDLPDGSGLDVLQRIREERTDTVVIMITGNVDVPNVLQALRGGAHDFIEKPIRLEELRVTLENALELKRLRREVATSRRERTREFGFERILGSSSAMENAKHLAQRVAASDVAAILLQGETGTGKDLFARAIHFASARSTFPYLAINCAALPATLIESELFGYEKGAFTDAKQKKEGLFEQAQGGTIFLDEIGEMELSLQAKLLRVLEEGTFRRVGGLKDLPLDVRILAASNQDLKKAGEQGSFRLDLYFRLSVIQVDIPPLRERERDVISLAAHYIEKANLKRRGVKLAGLLPEVERVFLDYKWPGNVRELRNVIERASILEDGEYVSVTHLPADMISGTNGHRSAPTGVTLPAEGIPLETVETELARQAFARTGGNLTRAAKLLNISRDQLRYKLRKAGDLTVDEDSPQDRD